MRLPRPAFHAVYGQVCSLGLAVLLGLLLGFLLALGPPTNAGDPVFDEPVVGVEPGLHAAARPDGQVADAAADRRATTGITSTLFFPVMSRNYWAKPPSLLGVQLFSTHQEQEAIIKADRAGTRWARLPILWFEIEPENTTPEHYQWQTTFDDWLRRLSGQNIQVILTLGGNPAWAAEYAGGPIDRVEIGELVEFLEAAVARYGAPPYNVKHWEFYNEPDNGSEFAAKYQGASYWGNYPAAYAQMLAAVYEPMKAIDPEAQVVFGGLAYDWFTTATPPGPFVRQFLDGVLANGGGAYFDIMNFHYYPAFHYNWEPYGNGIIGKTNYLRSKLAGYGLEKPFICSETFEWADAAHGGSAELQSRYLPQAFAQSMAAGLEITIWFTLVDDDDPFSGEFGLLLPSLSPRPAYWAYWTLARQLGPAAYVRTLGENETGSEEIEAYEFRSTDAQTHIIAAWSDDQGNHQMVVRRKSVLLVDKFGAQTLILDGDDGRVDGRVRVPIGPSPVYVRYSQ